MSMTTERLSHRRIGIEGREIPRSFIIKHNQVIFEVVSEIDLYSASVVGCFFDDQEIRLDPKNILNPPVDRLVLEQQLQSLSL